MNKNGGKNAVDEIGSTGGNFQTFPSEAKFLRLGFHDCVKYEDGSGGCDGCLNWHNMGFRHDRKAEFEYDPPTKGDNNGLRHTVEVLEELYTNPDFPKVQIMREVFQFNKKN